MFTKKEKIYTAAFAAVLCLFTLYAALDTFVIPRGYETVEEDTSENASVLSSVEDLIKAESTSEDDAKAVTAATETAASTVADTAEARENSDTYYHDDNITVELTEYTYCDTQVYVAEVRISSADYLKTAFANNQYGKNITAKTSVTAAKHNAVLAINGDYYGARTSGYVLRNGKTYRSTVYTSQGKTNEGLAIMSDGSFRLFTEGSVSLSSLASDGALQVFSFGPGLVDDGEILVSENDEVGKSMASNPRTAIAQFADSPLHLAFIVSDGRTGESDGLSLYQLAAFIQKLGANTAYNLDGGGSSTMYFNGRVVNNPTTTGKISERAVSDIVYIG